MKDVVVGHIKVDFIEAATGATRETAKKLCFNGYGT
jgi:hypothetical protein